MYQGLRVQPSDGLNTEILTTLTGTESKSRSSAQALEPKAAGLG